MTLNKRKQGKNIRCRGHRTRHGNTKNWRGKGSRGGVGNAGSHKHKWSNFFGTFGKRGFVNKTKKAITAFTLWDIQEMGDELKKDNKLKQENGMFVLELNKKSKILSNGILNDKILIRGASVSTKAKERLEAMGCKLE